MPGVVLEIGAVEPVRFANGLDAQNSGAGLGAEERKTERKASEDGGFLVLLLTRGMTWGNNFTSLCLLFFIKQK